jgi:glycine cleavage system transcriptional repressor
MGMAKEYLVVTAVGRDKVGTVEMITDVVAGHSANIEESRMARLGGEFAVIMLLSLAAEKVQPLVDALPSLQQKGLSVTSRRTDLTRLSEFQGFVPYEISVIGADHEGIVYRVARYLAAEGINVEEMDTHVSPAPNTGTPLFSMSARVQAPPNLTLRQLRSKLADVGEEIDVDIEIKLPKS